MLIYGHDYTLVGFKSKFNHDVGLEIIRNLFKKLFKEEIMIKYEIQFIIKRINLFNTRKYNLSQE